MALHHVDQIPIAQDADARRRWRISLEISPCLLGGVAVLAGEDRHGTIGFGGMLHCASDCGTHLPGGASADGVDNDHHRPWRLFNDLLEVSGSTGFFDAEASEFLTH